MINLFKKNRKFRKTKKTNLIPLKDESDGEVEMSETNGNLCFLKDFAISN